MNSFFDLFVSSSINLHELTFNFVFFLLFFPCLFLSFSLFV